MKWMKKQGDREHNALVQIIIVSLVFSFFFFESRDEKLDSFFLQAIVVGILVLLFLIDYLIVRLSYATFIKKKDELRDFLLNRFWKIYLTGLAISSSFIITASFFDLERVILVFYALAIALATIIFTYSQVLRDAFEIKLSLIDYSSFLVIGLLFVNMTIIFNAYSFAYFLGGKILFACINFWRISKVKKNFASK